MKQLYFFLALILVLLQPVVVLCQPKPVGWWIFDRAHMRQSITDNTGNHDAAMDVSLKFAEEYPHALVLNKNSSVISIPSVSASDLPVKQISVQAWVTLDSAEQWGGIIGYFQDNAVNNQLSDSQRQAYSVEKDWAFGSYMSLDAEKVATAPAPDQEAIARIQDEAKKGALAEVAIFPIIMLVCYLGLIIFFKAKGGYKAVELETGGSAGGESE